MALTRLNTAWIRGSYIEDAASFIVKAEGFNPIAYFDNSDHLAGSIAIGLGYDLLQQVPARIKEDFTGAGIAISAGQLNLIGAAQAGGTRAQRESARNALVNNLGVTLTADQAKSLLVRQLPSYDATLTRVLANSVPSMVGTLEGSYERIALLSLQFNGFLLTVGDGNRITRRKENTSALVEALNSGDRAEAWYLIRYEFRRYGYNANPGWAARAFAESAWFGMYDAATPDAMQAESAFRMYTRHRIQIQTYESSFPALINRSVATVVSNANQQFQTNKVKDLQAELITAKAPYLDALKTEYSGLAALNADDLSALDIQVASDPTKRAVLDGRYGDSRNAANVLVGGAESDVLLGGKGNDFLVGGAGRDEYQFNSGDGNDTVVDPDGGAALFRNGEKIDFGSKPAGSGSWAGRDSAGNAILFTKSGSGDIADLVITFTGSADSIVFKNYNFLLAPGDYGGIRLIDAPTAPTSPVRTFLGDKQDWDSDANQTGIQTQTDSFGNTIRADGQGGRVDIVETDRADVFYGSSANEVEKFQTGGGDDVVLADGVDSTTSSAGGHDLVEAGAGRDVVAAGAGNDWVEGGTGGDILGGNAGDDTLYAETSGGQTLTIDDAITAGESGDARSGPGDVLSGDAGDDILISDAGNDFLAGGTGEDVIVGGAGDDLIFGDASVTSAQLDWSVTRTIGGSGETVTFTVSRSNISISGEASVGGLDVIYGGAGDDWILAGAGDDSLDGGAGADVLLGEAGNDAITGGAGNDYLVGDSPADTGDDFLDGGAGDDVMIGGAGDDILYGGEGDDLISGGDGNDVIYGGAGTDVLAGGAGKDTYVFNRGDGLEVIQDTPAGADDPEASVLVLGPGIAQEDVTFRPGSLLIDLGEGDAIYFEGFNLDNPLSTPVLDAIQFADGTQMTYQDVLDLGFDIDGTSGDDVIEGTAVTDRIDGKAGDDSINAKGGDDVIDGGAGFDIINAGEGNDTVTTSGGGDVVFGGAGDDTVFAQDGDLIVDQEGVNHLDLTAYEGLISENLEITQYAGLDGETYLNFHIRDDQNVGLTPATGGVSVQRGEMGDFATLTLSDGESGTVTLSHAELMDQYVTAGLIYRGRDGDETLSGTPFADTLLAGAGADTVDGGAGNDRIDGGAGDDVLSGGAGNDTYLLAYHGGRDTVIEDGDAEQNATHTILLDAGISSALVRAFQVGDDLEVRLRATNDALILKDFYQQPTSWQEGWPLAVDEVVSLGG